MPRIAIVIILGLLCQSLVAQAPSAEPPEDQAVQVEAETTSPPTEDATPADPPQLTVIVEKVYRIYSTSDDSEVGTFTIRAVETEQTVQVVVELAVIFDDRSINVKTSVNCGQPSAEPVSAQVETFVDGEACMQGTIEFGETTYSYSGQGFRDDRGEEVFDPPSEFGEADLPMPAGPIVFLSDFAVMAPRLLTEAGTLEDLAIFRFPARIGPPELVGVQEGCQLVREPADADGNVVFELYYPVPRTRLGGELAITQQLTSSVTYNADGEIVYYQANREWRLVEIAQEELAEDDQPVEEAPSEEGDE